MNIDNIESEIQSHYRFFADQAPGVPVQEVGTLSQLWSLADYMYREQAIDMTDKQIVYNFGYTTLREVGR